VLVLCIFAVRFLLIVHILVTIPLRLIFGRTWIWNVLLCVKWDAKLKSFSLLQVCDKYETH